MTRSGRARMSALLFGSALLLVCEAGLAQTCYESMIQSPTPFMGNNSEVFKLADGSVWEVKYEYEYLYEYHPTVVICPSRGKLIIKGKSLNVEQLAAPPQSAAKRASPGGKGPATLPQSTESPAVVGGIIESRIKGEFNGWDGETVFVLDNGQIWQQAAYTYTYSYKYRPPVMIFPTTRGYEMQVEGMDSRLLVKRLK